MTNAHDTNITLGRKLYDEGLALYVIAERCCTTRDVVRRWARAWPERSKRAAGQATRGAAAVAIAVATLEARKRVEQQIIGRASVTATTRRTLPPLSIESMPILTFDTDFHV